MEMEITMKAKFWLRDAILEMVRAYFTVQTSKSGRTMSIMVNGSRIYVRGKATATITMRTCMSASGKVTKDMGSESCSIGSRIGTRASGGMT